MFNWACEIYYSNPGDVEQIWKITNSYEEDIDIRCGRYTADAKSIMALMMFLCTPIEIYINSGKSGTYKLENDLDRWQVVDYDG